MALIRSVILAKSDPGCCSLIDYTRGKSVLYLGFCFCMMNWWSFIYTFLFLSHRCWGQTGQELRPHPNGSILPRPRRPLGLRNADVSKRREGTKVEQDLCLLPLSGRLYTRCAPEMKATIITGSLSGHKKLGRRDLRRVHIRNRPTDR